MKKTIAVLMLAGCFATVTHAQTAPPPPPAPPAAPEKPKMTKEEKEKQKIKQEEELAAAFKETGLSEDQIKLVKEVNADANKKRADIKKDDALSEDQKKEKGKEVNSDASKKLKEIMGDVKFKQYNTIRKQQKEAAQDKM